MKNLVIIIMLCTLQTYGQQSYRVTDSPLLEWQGKAAFSSYSPVGSLVVQQATITLKNDSITALVVSVDMTTLTQENKQLEGHLRGADFFDVTVYSTASFTLLTPVPLAANVVLKGLMTIRGKTNSEVINANLTKQEQGWLVSFGHEFDRTTYGINYNSPSIFKRLKENAVADQFRLKGVLHFKQMSNY